MLPPLQGWAEVVVITDRDLCAAEDPACAGDPLRALLDFDLMDSSIVSLIAGLPPDLVDEASLSALDIDREARLAAIATDSRLADDAEPIACDGVVADPAGRIVRELASHSHRGALLSLCALDAETLLDRTYYYCQGGADGAWITPPADVSVQPDGKVACELLETLPEEGPITHCDQLSQFGRGPDFSGDDGRETCALDQLVAEGGVVPSGYGFFHTAQPITARPDRPPVRGDFLRPCFGLIPSRLPHIELSPETALIAGSRLTMRCQLDHRSDAGCDP